jgi:hypothetical protein
MKDKKYYHVVFSGLNELGVSEMNEFYKYNQQKYNTGVFKLNADITKRSKRFRFIKQFGPESLVETYDLSAVEGEDNRNIRGRSYFSIQIKHLNHQIYEVNETYTLVK